MATLDDLYELYCSAASELRVAPPGSARAAKLLEEADRNWLQYIEQGGGRELWHKTDKPWVYKDGFVEMRHSSTLGPVQQLREYLKLPTNVGPHYMGSEEAAVKRFQEHHNLPVTGVVDRKTWQAILKPKGERKPVVLPSRLELPGVAASAVPLTVRTRKRWKLALDDVPQRTFANQNNLAVLAEYAYAKPADFKAQFETLWNRDRLREDAIATQPGSSARLLLREADSTFAHEVKFIVNWDTSTQLYVIDSPEYLIVSFRGTDPAGVDSIWNDVATDLRARGERWMYDGTFDGNKAIGALKFQVHQGFGKAFDSIRNELRDALNKATAGQPGKTIFVTGHSLGAALATLCACYIRSHPALSSHPVQLYTFASPRVGTKPFAEHYWKDPKLTYYRMANFLDTITIIPSKYLADEVADGADLLIDAVDLVSPTKYLVLSEIAAWQTKKWARDNIHDLCPPELDYRHFGTLVLCGVNTQNRPFVYEMGKGLPRVIEDGSNAKLQAIWNKNPYWHGMGNYRRFMMHAFEEHARAYLSGAEAALPLSAGPALHPAEAQLFHRYIHESGVPAYHSIEDYREGFR